MPLDPSIALQTKPVVLPNPVDMYSNVLGLQNAQQNLQLNALRQQVAQRDFDNTNALQAQYKDPNFASLPFDQQQQALLSAGGSAAVPVIKSMIDNRKTNVETNNAQQTNSAAQAKDIAQTVESAKSPEDLIQLGFLGAQQGRWDIAKFQPVISTLLSGKYNDPQSFGAFKQQLGDSIRSPDALATANTPTPTKVTNGFGGDTFVDTNSRTNPGIIGTQVQGNPILTTGPQGDPLTRNTAGTTVTQPTFVPPGAPPVVGGPAPVAAPMVQPTVAGAARFVGNPDVVRAAAARIADPQDRANALAAVDNWKAAGAPQGSTVAPSFAQWNQANPAPTMAANDPTSKNYTAPLMAANVADYAKGVQTRAETYQSLLPMMDKFQQALQAYQTGPGADTRLALAKAVAAIPGVSTDNPFVQAINRGPIGDAQEIQKLQGSMALELIKSTLNGAGKVGQGEFRILEPKFPGIDTDPKATQMIFDLTRQQAGRTYAEQQALSQTPSDQLTTFPARWAKYLNDTGTLPVAQGSTPAPISTAPVKVASEAAYNALPSGARYIGPDGHTRVKQ